MAYSVGDSEGVQGVQAPHSKFLNILWPNYFIFIGYSGVVTVQGSQSGKSFSLILNLATNVQKSPIKCLKEQNIHRKQSVYAYLIVIIWSW